MLPTVSSPSLAPSAGILSPLTERLMLCAISETYRAARAAGRSGEEAMAEADEAGQRLARLVASAGLECES